MTRNGQAGAAAQEIEKLIRIHFRNSYRDGLRPAQWQALRYFASAGPEERSLTAFARHRRSTMGTASITVSQLVERGFMERGDPEGQRNVGLRLTEQGRAALQNDPIEELVDAISGLEASKIEGLRESLSQIADRLEHAYAAEDDSA